MSTGEFQAHLDQALAAWIEAGETSPCSQTWPSFANRVLGALTELATELTRGQTALVFTSAGPVASVCSTLLSAPATGFLALNRVQVNTGVTRIASGTGGLSLVTVNEHGHLGDARGQLVTYR